MTRSPKQPARPLFLGIEGGGTHTVALLADAQSHLLQRLEIGPANLKLLGDAQLLALFKSVAAAFPRPDALGIGLAGARTEADWTRIRTLAAKVWPGVPCDSTNDLETALLAAEKKIGGTKTARVLILSGTGSCCYGRNAAGKTAKIGGWGHILGDAGSGYAIGLSALKAVVANLDQEGKWSKLGERLLRGLQLNEPNELIAWAQAADKSQIASLAVEVFKASKDGDQTASEILATAQTCLAGDALACALQLARPADPVEFILAGGILLKQPGFARGLATRLRKARPGAVIFPLQRESAWGAVTLAKNVLNFWQVLNKSAKPALKFANQPVEAPPQIPISSPGKLSPTEQRHPLSLHLDKLSIAEGIALMLSEDAKIPSAILAERKKIARAVGLITQTFKRGGRLIYVGAGTSGRLGVLDASECPPTFRTSPEMVQGIIAGGQAALWRSVEGAEDDPAAGARAIAFRAGNRRDIVAGIAASGRTPFVWGALGEAKKRGAKTILLAFNPHLKISRAARPTLLITPNLGPELLTGSTRLKAGTATKLILNMFTTLAMVRLGKVVSNLMVDLNPSNVKLRDRAVRIVQELRGVDCATAQDALEKSGWVIQRAGAKLSAKKIGPL